MRYEHLYEEGLKRLKSAGIMEADSDCFIMFSEAFGLTRSSYFFRKNEEIDAADVDKISLYLEWIARREKHEPVQYIIGNQEFFGLKFKVDGRVLIPRLDTEVLVDELLKCDTRGKRILDLCTGSGCILITAMKNGGFASGIGTDISEAALDLAKENASLNNVDIKLLQGDLLEALDCLEAEEKIFDYVTANPPYIAEEEKKDLAEEVIGHEPWLALFAEKEGLALYEKILASVPVYMAPGAKIFFEIGCSQGEKVSELCGKAGLINIKVVKDLAGLDRVVIAEKE